MSEVPDELIKSVAEVLLRHYDEEFDDYDLSWHDFTGKATDVLAVAVPKVRQQIAEEIAPIVNQIRKAARTHHYAIACRDTDVALGRLVTAIVQPEIARGGSGVR